MRRKQLGGNKNIRLGLIPIPAGIFLELTGNAYFAVKVSRFLLTFIPLCNLPMDRNSKMAKKKKSFFFSFQGDLRHSISAGSKVSLGGKCRLSDGCHSTADTVGDCKV